jgi:threonine aldolase
MKVIDMRSDTVTKPTDEMRAAMAAAVVGDDVYGDDETTNELERRAAEACGKQAALFVPSGTFGNQLALGTHCQSGNEVILYDDCHIVQHEAGAAATIARVQLRALEGPGSAPDAEKIESRIRLNPDDIHYPRTGLICLENAHSDGKVASLADMKAVTDVAKKHGVPVHLDGARLFNAATHLGVSAANVAACVDSVMFCLAKGLCAPVGSILAGSSAFVAAARRKRKLMGGGMRQTGILAAAGLLALGVMTERLGEDHANAQALAQKLAAVSGIAINPEDVHINLVFFRLPGAVAEQKMMAALKTNNILANAPENGSMRLATHNGVSAEDVQKVAEIIGAVV